MASDLELYINSHERKTFHWGVNDCCTFASNWVEVKTRINPLSNLGFYGRYDNENDANKLLKKLGGLPKILTDALGEEKPVAYARPGDIVLGELEHGETLGICLGTQCVFLGLRSLIFKDTVTMTSAWSI